MQINLSDISDRHCLKESNLFQKIASKALDLCGLSQSIPTTPSCLNVIICNDEQIEKTNWDYLRHEGPTDVISFDYLDDFDKNEEYSLDDPFVIGELFISSDTAKRQAQEYDQPFNDELILYLVHGILHLAGYDDHCEEDIRDMRNAEADVIQKLRQQFHSLQVI